MKDGHSLLPPWSKAFANGTPVASSQLQGATQPLLRLRKSAEVLLYRSGSVRKPLEPLQSRQGFSVDKPGVSQ
jgi:hypothetical protein